MKSVYTKKFVITHMYAYNIKNDKKYKRKNILYYHVYTYRYYAFLILKTSF